MERTPFSPDTELPAPIKSPIEKLLQQSEMLPREAQITEGLFVAEALSRQPHMLYEQVGRTLQSDEPFEKTLERKVEVKDESTTSPVVSIGSVVADIPIPQTAYTTVSTSSQSSGVRDDLMQQSATTAAGLKGILSSPIYQQAMMMGFLAALVVVALFLFVMLLTRLL